jgi:hypothetical protein
MENRPVFADINALTGKQSGNFLREMCLPGQRNKLCHHCMIDTLSRGIQRQFTCPENQPA